jgi:hypothetical protein
VFIEFSIVFFVLGHIVSSFTEMFSMGKNYFIQYWNIHEIVNNLFFVGAFAVGTAAWISAPPLVGFNFTDSYMDVRFNL